MKAYVFTLLLAFVSLQSLAQRSGESRHYSASHHDWDGASILTFQPFGFAVVYSNANPTVGLDYEYIVSKKLGLGVHVPIMFGFNAPDNYLNGEYDHTMFYTAPGVRFHVGGKGRSHIDFSTGPSIVIGNQHYKPNTNYYYVGITAPQAYNLNFTGIAADNVLNVQRGNFIFGFNTRVGYTFDRNSSTRYFMDLGMHFGGRF